MDFYKNNRFKLVKTFGDEQKWEYNIAKVYNWPIFHKVKVKEENNVQIKSHFIKILYTIYKRYYINGYIWTPFVIVTFKLLKPKEDERK